MVSTRAGLPNSWLESWMKFLADMGISPRTVNWLKAINLESDRNIIDTIYKC